MGKVSFIQEFDSIADGYVALNSLETAEIFEATHTSDGRFYIFGETSQSETVQGSFSFEDPDRRIASVMLGLNSDPVKDSMAIVESQSLANLVEYITSFRCSIHEILTAKSTGGKSVAFIHADQYPSTDGMKITEIKDLKKPVKDLF